MPEKQNNQPLQRLRDGGINITFWEQQSKNNAPFVTVNISKTYKDRNGKFQEGHSFTAKDIAKLNTLMPFIQHKTEKFQEVLKDANRSADAPAPEQQNDMVAQREAVMKQAKDARAAEGESPKNTQEHAQTYSEPER